MSVFYEVIPEFNSDGRLCNYHTGEDGENVRVAEEEWQRFSQLAGRQHEIVDGFIIYNSNLEPCLPDISISQDEFQRLLVAESLGIDLPVETKAKAMDALCLGLPGLPEPEPSGEWVAGKQILVGATRTYQGQKYECIQGHVTQVGWEPGSEGGRTLFRILREEPGEGEDPLDFVWGELVSFGAIRRDPIDGKYYTPVKETGVILYEPHFPHMVPSEYQEVLISGNGGNEPDPEEILPWAAGVDVVVGDKRTYNEKIYSCLQAHKTQAGWVPPNVPSLWKEVTG